MILIERFKTIKIIDVSCSDHDRWPPLPAWWSYLSSCAMPTYIIRLTASEMSRCRLVLPSRGDRAEPYALYNFGPRSGLTKNSGSLEARLSMPLRCVYSGSGSDCIRSWYRAGIMSAKSSVGGQSFSFRMIGSSLSSVNRSEGQIRRG